MAWYHKILSKFSGNAHIQGSRDISQNLEQRSTTLKNPAPWLLFGGMSSSGVNVSEETALGISALWRAVAVISDTIAGLPFKLFEQMTDGDRITVTNHPVARLIRSLPKDLYTPFVFWQSLIANAILRGAGAAVIMRDDDGRPERLKILEGKIEPYENENGEFFYYSTVAQKVIPFDDVLYIPGILISDGKKARSIVSTFREELGAAIAAVKHGGNYFKNGTMISGYLKYPEELTDKQIKRVKTQLHNYEGVSGSDSQGTLVLENGGELKPAVINPRDSQLVENIKLNVENVARITGVPLYILQQFGQSSYNSQEQSDLAFLKYTLNPWLVKIEQEAERKLLSSNEQGGRMYFKHITNGLLRVSAKDRAQFYKDLYYLGALNANEIRKFEDMNKIPNGDEYMTQVNLMPTEQIINPPAEEGGENRSDNEKRRQTAK